MAKTINNKSGLEVYSEDMAARVCEAVATTPGGLQAILKENGIKITARTIYNWLQKYPDFRKAFELAREDQAEIIYEEMLEAAKDSSQDMIRDNRGFLIPNPSAVQRSRVVVDVFKFALSKLCRRRWGDSTDIKVAELAEQLQALKELLGEKR